MVKKYDDIKSYDIKTNFGSRYMFLSVDVMCWQSYDVFRFALHKIFVVLGFL